ncbi:unnamed protein product [Eruca vesicaria subsp. sativa]|uniref:glutamate--cysteine ligase n=1 Tax=Eruca vesicaria subsp. sativa TaxID=29727 RepID=A0ABC8IZ16_ERUVS|nr:unnamed protein product [Eruca vesicaria subsp. sativa]
MVFFSQAGGSYTLPSRSVCSKTGTKSVSGGGGVRNLRMKEAYVSSCSLLKTSHYVKRIKRGHQLIVAASPPTEETTVVETEPLTREDLIAYLASGCKSKDKWRIGTEHEKFGFEVNSLRPMKYDQIAELLNSIAERFEWEKVMEGDKIIGRQDYCFVDQGKQSISLEPGGQFELSGAPLETLHQTCAEVNSHLYQVKAVAEELGIGFLGIGFQPKWRREDIPIMPKANLDFSSEADMIRKFRASLALQPIATTLFANSPFTKGKPNRFLSMRSHIWTDTDKDRTGMLPFVFDDSFGFEQYVDYALDVPMYFAYRNKKSPICYRFEQFLNLFCNPL